MTADTDRKALADEIERRAEAILHMKGNVAASMIELAQTVYANASLVAAALRQGAGAEMRERAAKVADESAEGNENGRALMRRHKNHDAASEYQAGRDTAREVAAAIRSLPLTEGAETP